MNFEPLRALMETLVAEGVPGCELAVCRGHKVLFHECAGFSDAARLRPATPFDRYLLCSCTKPVTAVGGLESLQAAEDAIARLRAADPGLALRSVTLTAKEKVCLHPDAEGRPACLPELCPFANGYYSRVKDALAALLDGPGSFDRAALADTAWQFSVCPFELGLDLSEWCDVVIGDYNYLFDGGASEAVL